MTETLYITEFSGLGYTGPNSNQHIQAPSGAGVTAFNSVSLSSSSGRSNQLNANTRLVKLCSDTDCWLNYGGSTVTAAVGDDYLPAKTVLFLTLNPSTYIAAIAAA